MKKLIFIVFALVTVQFNAQQNLKFKIVDLQDTTVFLARYFGERLYYADTATSMLNDKGFPKSLFFISDSLHLSKEGYRNWDNVLLTVMNEALGLD